MQNTATAPQETFPTQRTLCRRIGCDETEASRYISSGRLKFSERNGRRYYLTADLDAIAAEKRRKIVMRASRMGPDERRKLIEELAAENAFLHFKAESDHRDMAAAEKRVNETVYDAKVEELEASLKRLNETVARLSFPSPGSRRLQLRAEKIDTTNGVIRAATVAMAGVQAVGKFHVGADGKRYPVWTDEKTLETLLAAARDRVKTREDHVDEVGARAGYSSNFKRVGDRVVCDVTLFASYGNRDVVLETAEKAPSQIGLSIDFQPQFEIVGDKAFMRVVSLEAVDIVDAGAVTPNGLL